MITRPFTFTGSQLWLNYATSAAGGVRVELQDLEGKALPGFALADCDELFGDTVDRVVTWRRGESRVPEREQPIRLRLELRDAHVFAWQFRPE